MNDIQNIYSILLARGYQETPFSSLVGRRKILGGSMSIQVDDMKLYDVEELAEILSVGLPTIRRYLRQGKLRGKKLAKRWYVSEDNLKDYFQPVVSPVWQEEK